MILAALIAILLALALIAYLIDWHVGTVRGQLTALATMLGAFAEGLRETNELLREIANDTEKMPKVDNRTIEERTYLD